MSPVELEVDDGDAALVDWKDLYERVDRARKGIAKLADLRDDPFDHERLLGKAEGLALVLSYMREYRPEPG